MSIRYGLLALLEHEPMYGYQLRGEFETRTGGTWPLNVGQVYTTLSRLERDGLVQQAGADDDGRANYRITADGRGELQRWFATPVAATDRPRDELAIKLALAVTTPGVDIPALVQRQRSATVRALQDYVRLKRRAGEHELAWLLVLDALIYQAEAEVRWLDACESRVTAVASARRGRAASATDTQDKQDDRQQRRERQGRA